MNKLQIFNKWEREDEISAHTPTHGPTLFHGYVYAVEYGNQIKIGMTRNVNMRMKKLKSHAEKYGSVSVGGFAWSTPHTNFADNEKILHKHFAARRREGKELINLTMDEFMENMPELSYEDRSREYSEKSELFVENMKDFIQGTDHMDTNREEYEILAFILSILSDETKTRIISEMLNYGSKQGFTMREMFHGPLK